MFGSPIFYAILTAFFFLLFFLSVLLFEWYRKRTQPVLKKKDKPLTKFSWDTLIKGLAAAGIILFSRTSIYYIPFDGIVQSKFSIWWVEGKAQSLLVISILVLFVIGLGWLMLKRDIEEVSCGIILIFILVLAFFVFEVMKLISGGDFRVQFPITGQHFILIFFAPLVLLKMLFSGKYLGLLTGFILGCFVVAGYKKLKTITGKRLVNILLAPVFLFLIFFVFSSYQSLGNLREKFHQRVQSAESLGEIEELLDAVNTINNETTKSYAIQRLAKAIGGTADTQWKQETFKQAIRTTKSIYNNNLRSIALKEIAVSIGKTGDIPWALEVAVSIPAEDIRNNVLNELREKLEEK